MPSVCRLLLLLCLATPLCRAQLPLQFVVKTLYEISKGPQASAEPHRPILLAATGISEVNNEKNHRLNSVKLEDEIFEQTRIVLRHPPNIKDLQQQLAVERVNQMAALAAEDEIAGFMYEWKIGDFTYDGRTVATIIESEGVFDVHLIEKTFPGRNITREAHGTLSVAKVRRELSHLRASDKRKFFDTAKLLYNTPLNQGRETYGEKYLDMQTLWAAHNMLAVDGASAEELGVMPAEERRDKATKHSIHTHSYRQEVHPGAMLEVDGDTNNWHNHNDQLIPYRLGVVARAMLDRQAEEMKLLEGSAAARDNKDKHKGAVQQRLSSHSVLVETGHSKLESNYGAFALMFEDAIQAVDPSVTIPYWDQTDTEGDASRIPISSWREKHQVPLSMVSASAPMLTHDERQQQQQQQQEGEEEIVEVETVGKWAYFPIIVDTKMGKDHNGKEAVIYKGFKVPMMATEPMHDQDKDAHSHHSHTHSH